MSDGATWTAFGMAVLSLIGTIFANINARAAARDKMEFERQTVRDKMEFDAKLMALESELASCRQQHICSEQDRNQLRAEIETLRTELAALRRSV